MKYFKKKIIVLFTTIFLVLSSLSPQVAMAAPEDEGVKYDKGYSLETLLTYFQLMKYRMVTS